jgi:hypothetical protein
MIHLDKLILAVFFDRQMLSAILVWMINSRLRWARHVECMGENRRTCSIFVSKYAGKKTT